MIKIRNLYGYKHTIVVGKNTVNQRIRYRLGRKEIFFSNFIQTCGSISQIHMETRQSLRMLINFYMSRQLIKPYDMNFKGTKPTQKRVYLVSESSLTIKRNGSIYRGNLKRERLTTHRIKFFQLFFCCPKMSYTTIDQFTHFLMSLEMLVVFLMLSK